MPNSNNRLKKVALISTPWPLYNRPSIQLGALKSYLKSKHSDVKVDARHFYLKLAESLGYKRYQQISERTWLAESIYAALLFPDRFEVVKKLFDRETRSKPLLKELGLKEITIRTKEVTDAYISGLNWNDYLLAGLSVSLCQLTSSLYFIKRLNEKFPDLVIVIGGSTFSGSAAENLFKLFPDIDVVINGEGELPLSRLIDSLGELSDLNELPPIEGVITAYSAVTGAQEASFNQLDKLNPLPPPDYDDYFALLKSFQPDKVFFPELSVETSRGCWWQKISASERHRTGCAFCNLNLQWQGYRHKDTAQVINEIDYLTGRYQSLSVSIVDNILPGKTSREVFRKVIDLKKDLRFFAEIRANTSASELKLMSRAGMKELQIGIEALSSSLLKKLQKGTSAIQNLEIMRNCEALGIVNSSNLILNFPGSNERDVAETLRNLEFALPYRPLQTVNFWLGLGSPVWQDHEEYGIRAIFNHPDWNRLFPRKITQSIPFIIQGYRGDIGFQKKIWQTVKKKAQLWKKSYDTLRQGSGTSPILSYRDGRDFLIITQRRYQADSIKHRLVGTSRLIYLFCMEHRRIEEICSRFPDFAEEKVVAFLKMMVDKKLMFEENDNYLSLAIPLRMKIED
jgi:ribosomal peptide maturation radical SAM protein 1